MDYIELSTGSMLRHAMLVRYDAGHGRTWCGLTIKNGVTGACIRPMIECKRCIKGMEASGR